VAYCLLLACGPTGLHLAYVGRKKQAAIWACTFGGFFVGVLRDVFCLPRYVREANGNEDAVKKLKKDILDSPKPKWRFARLLCEFFVGAFMGFWLSCCDELGVFLDVEPSLVSQVFCVLGVTFGVWLAGCVGNEQVSFVQALVAASFTNAFLFINGYEELSKNSPLTKLTSAHTVSFFAMVAANFGSGRSWRKGVVEGMQEKKLVKSGRFTILRNLCYISFVVACFAPLVGYGTYSYGSFDIDDANGGKKTVSVKFCVDQFFDEHMDEWQEIKGALNQVYTRIQNDGFQTFFNEIMKSTPYYAESKALGIMGLEKGADQNAIRKRFRKLSLQYHPDRMINKPEAEKAEKAEEYERIVEAFEILSNKK